MATPFTGPAAAPLAGLRFDASGPPEIMSVVTDHLGLLGARADGPGRRDSAGHTALTGGGFEPAETHTQWAGFAGEVTDEATAQAVTGVMAVHGRRDGAPRALAADYTATATGVLTVQALLAGLLAQARGGPAVKSATSADRAGLLAVSQYLAAAGAPEPEATGIAPGGPPFTSADGVVFELETLDAGAWAEFWRAVGAPESAVREGWRPFQFRYATACAPFPGELHTAVRGRPWAGIREAAERSGAQVCALHTLAARAAEHDHAPPWTLTPLGSFAGGRGDGGPPAGPAPLAGLTVLEAGRRIQAPLAAQLLNLLGAEVIRIEPPGGDPLRGMPPACSGVSARWLALNRGKSAVEVDIKSAGDRERLRELAAGADVFLHNWAPGKAAELGLDHPDLAAVNPALVYAYTGGWAGRLPGAPMGTDFMVQARTGVGEAVRPADEPPVPSLMTLLDVLGGLTGAEAVLAGLLLRERTGRGARVDSSLLGAADVLTAPALRRGAEGGSFRRPAGFRRPLRTADGWIAVADSAARAAAGHDLRASSTGSALELLRSRGLSAAAVTADLAGLPHDARFQGVITRDPHGAPAVPAPWSFL
ncbi:CoA transferase [Streptomyces sp. CAU 1734]|uniref:CoA transferase n=1 Tax=Streptomyces sp. CAU 1734 TaxID=3140360 RepID=UPI0032607280